MKTSFKKFSLGVLTTLLVSNSALSYNIVERARLNDDKLKTLQMTRPYGHDFIFDIQGAFTTDIMDLQDAADKIDKVNTGNISTDIDEVNNILEPFYNKEQVLRADLNFGIPIFSFNAFGVDIEPNLRFGGGLFAMMTPSKVRVSILNVIDALPVTIPAELKTKLKACVGGLTDGDDIISKCLSAEEAEIVKKEAGVDEIIYDSNLGTKDTPSINVYAKGEARAGLWFDYKKDKHWFGTFGLYALGRVDVQKEANAVILLGGGGNFDLTDNTTVNMVTDYRFGYKNSNYSVFAAVEELKLATIKDESTETNFGYDPLLRLHGQADYRLWKFKLTPYAGFHARSGYGIGDAYYLGADWGMFVWEDRIGLNFKTQLDKEHFTLGARAKLWILHVDATGKFAVSDEVDGIKVSNYYTANIRFFF